MIVSYKGYKIGCVCVHRQQDTVLYVAALFDGYLPCVITSRTSETAAVAECVRLFNQEYLPAQERMRKFLRKADGKTGLDG